MPAVRAHGEAWMFTVCLRRRHTTNSRRRRQLAVTASARFFSPCAYIYTRRKSLPCAQLLTHGKQDLCRPRGCRRRFAVGHRRRSLRRVPRAHVELVVSSSVCSSTKHCSGGFNNSFSSKTRWFMAALILRDQQWSGSVSLRTG